MSTQQIKPEKPTQPGEKQEHFHEHDSHHHHHEHTGEHHGHTHGTIDPSIIATQKGIWAVKWSFFWLFLTALFQIAVVIFSGSVALFADTIHNIADAATAIPLWIAFKFSLKKPGKRFTYGYGRVEDLAGVTIVLIILFSAILAGYEAVQRIIHPQTIQHLWAVIIASVIGFLGNEAVAIFRIKTGKEIGSAALITDGYHARIDGITSLAVLFGAVGVGLGFPLADPIIGLVITIAILKIVWDSVKTVFIRLLDGVEPEIIDEIYHTIRHQAAVENISEVRARWIGHRLHAEINLTINSQLTIEQGHEIVLQVQHQLLHSIPYLSTVIIHVDPVSEAGEEYHHFFEHQHDGLPLHSH